MVPIVVEAIAGKIVVQHIVQREVQRVTIAADRSRVRWVDRVFDGGLHVARIRVEVFGIAPDLLLAIVQHNAERRAVNCPVVVVQYPVGLPWNRHILCSVDAEAIVADCLHQPLRVPHQVSQGVFRYWRAVHGIRQVERINLDILLARCWIVDADRIQRSIGIECAVGIGGHVGQAAVRRRGAGRNVIGVAGHRVAYILVVRFLGDVDQVRQARIIVAAPSRIVKVAVKQAGRCEHKAGIPARAREAISRWIH